MDGAPRCADFLFGKKMCGKRGGLFFSAFFTRKIFQAADRRDYALEKAGWSVSEKFSYQQNFPTSHSGARGRGLPPVQLPPPGTAPPFFRLIKPPVEGRKILLIRHNPSLTSYSAKKCAVKDGDFCSLHFSLGRFFEPQTGGTTHPRNRGFFTGEGRLRGARGE